jgi:hypothetical protein
MILDGLVFKAGIASLTILARPFVRLNEAKMLPSHGKNSGMSFIIKVTSEKPPTPPCRTSSESMLPEALPMRTHTVWLQSSKKPD